MPLLLLMRHGKAAQAARFADRERPLTPRGRHDAEAMGATIARAFHPDRILCSAAIRTRQTLAAVLHNLGAVSDISFVDDLYDAPGDYSDIIARHGGMSECLLVIGHNPAIQETAITLIGAGEAAVRAELHDKFTTSAVAAIAFERGWASVEPLSGRLEAFLTP